MARPSTKAPDPPTAASQPSTIEPAGPPGHAAPPPSDFWILNPVFGHTLCQRTARTPVGTPASGPWHGPINVSNMYTKQEMSKTIFTFFRGSQGVTEEALILALCQRPERR